jgi:hypothetical protein
MIVPFIDGWIWHRYGNVPGVVNVKLYVPVPLGVPLLNSTGVVRLTTL